MECRPKQCIICDNTYQPTGRCSKYCPNCRPLETRRVAKQAVKNWSIKKGIYKGTGSGSATGIAEKNHMYVHGKSVFDRWARERLEKLKHCERCNTPLSREKRGSWAGHHKDHNPDNNVIENLELLCRRCHAIEHKCWEAFEGVTTISKESRVDNNSKRLAP